MNDKQRKAPNGFQAQSVKEMNRSEKALPKCPNCRATLSAEEISSHQCSSCHFLLLDKHPSFSIFPIISLLISIGCLCLYGIVLNGTNLIGLWTISCFVSMLFPLVSKYVRNRNNELGKPIELLSMIIGSFNLYSYFFTATEISTLFIFGIIALAWILYLKLFNDI